MTAPFDLCNCSAGTCAGPFHNIHCRQWLLASHSEFIAWAKAQGAKRVKVADVEIEFFAPVQSVTIPLPGQPAAAPAEPETFGEPKLAVPEDPTSAHLEGCLCETCAYLFPKGR